MAHLVFFAIGKWHWIPGSTWPLQELEDECPDSMNSPGPGSLVGLIEFYQFDYHDPADKRVAN
jgi:hypothetical protein